jgi:hypothetical protein
MQKICNIRRGENHLQKLIFDVENVCAKTDETLLDERPGGC